MEHHIMLPSFLDFVLSCSVLPTPRRFLYIRPGPSQCYAPCRLRSPVLLMPPAGWLSIVTRVGSSSVSRKTCPASLVLFSIAIMMLPLSIGSNRSSFLTLSVYPTYRIFQMRHDKNTSSLMYPSWHVANLFLTESLFDFRNTQSWWPNS